MMVKPSVQELLEKVDNRYRLVIVTSKRARQIFEAEQKIDAIIPTTDKKPLSTAADEIFDGKVVAVND